MRACLVDVRCLQDPPFRERGIGRHARALLSRAREFLPGRRIVGLADAAMPALPADVRALLDEVRTNGSTGALTDRCSFVQLSPMTHDPLFVARLLTHPAVASAAVVYDFIPLDEPDRYLGDAGTHLDYHVNLRWLARHGLFLPISADAAARLQELLEVPGRRIVVTGAPLDPAFETLPPGRPRHVLVVAGADPRKNPDCVIRAHAEAAALQAARVPLVITGAYGAEWLDAQRNRVAELGGDRTLLLAPGHVDEADLLRLYADAWCVVAPSRAEGFSLPVVEAMAAQAPVLASDIPAHRELLQEGLFEPDDAATLAGLLELAMQPKWRAAALARQAAVWPRFREVQVARRFWAAVDRLVPGAPPSTPARKPRLALLTPLPPDRSGVADYSAATCPELGKRVELHVFTPTRSPGRPDGAATVNPLSALPLLSNRFDRVVAVLGNSVFHLEILRLLLRHGGAAILHDGRMLDLYAGHMGLEKTVAMAEAELGRPLPPNEIWAWLAGDTPPAALILSEIAAAAEPLLMHSRAGIEEVGRRYGKPAVHLPFSPYRTMADGERTPAARQAARARLGIDPGTVLVASFGYVHLSKAPVECIWALDLLRAWGTPAALHFVGAPLTPLEPLAALVDGLDLGAQVVLPSEFVDEQSYRDHLIAADLGIQLRTSGAGSVSGALADCVAAGLPTVASATLAAALDAPDFVRPVPDSPSPVLIAEAAAALLDQPDTTASRLAYAGSRGFDRYAATLCEALGLA